MDNVNGFIFNTKVLKMLISQGFIKRVIQNLMVIPIVGVG